MGQTLSEPVTTKETESVSNANYRVAASCMQGWRINMEDQHTLLLSLKEDKDAAFFAVFDGHGEIERMDMKRSSVFKMYRKLTLEKYRNSMHSEMLPSISRSSALSPLGSNGGGSFNPSTGSSGISSMYSQAVSSKGTHSSSCIVRPQSISRGFFQCSLPLYPMCYLCNNCKSNKPEGSKVANYCGEYLHKKIVSQQGYDKGDIVSAMRSGFLSCDDDMRQDDAIKDEMAGSTAICILVKDNTIFSANCGDSRAIASVSGRVEELSFDHKPSNEDETKRIVAAGGWVEFNRVNGNLALSRAMGDFMFKRNSNKSPEEQIVTANPDITVKKITQDHEFIFLACDGIWDVMSNEEVVDFVRSRIAKRMSPELICEEILGHCLAPDCQMGGLGCDNMTVILVGLLNGGTYEDLAKKCARQVDSPMKENGSTLQDDEDKNMDLL